MALEREQVERLSLGTPAPSSTPIAPLPAAPSPVTGQPTKPPTSLRHLPFRIWFPAFLLSILLFGGVGYAINSIWLVARATITLVPASTTMSSAMTIDAVRGSPTPSQAQVTSYTAASKRESATHAASGVGHQTAVQATGRLWFYSLAGSEITVPEGFTFRGANGVSVATDAPAFVPAGNPPQQLGTTSVLAHAIQPGASGNIAALDVNVALSGNYNGIAVKNLAPFAGGVNEKSYPSVTRADIAAAAGPLETSLTQAARTALLAKLGRGEQFLAAPSCSPTVQPSPALGQAGAQVTVSVQVFCRGDAYNRNQVIQLATIRLTQQATAQLGTAYIPVGPPTSGTIRATVVDAGKGQFTLAVPISERYSYHFSQATLQRLPKLLAGRSSSAASKLLLTIPGVAQASIQLAGWNNGDLPTDVTEIGVVIGSPRAA